MVSKLTKNPENNSTGIAVTGPTNVATYREQTLLSEVKKPACKPKGESPRAPSAECLRLPSADSRVSESSVSQRSKRKGEFSGTNLQ